MSLSIISKDGNKLVNFKDISVSKSMENLCGSFNFKTTTDSQNRFPVLVGDKIEILADDVKIMTAFVEIINIDYDSQNHSIEVVGRSTLCDLVDSTISSNSLEFENQISLIQIGEIILKDAGIDIDIINEAGEINPFDFIDIESAGIAQKGFDFFESFAKKRQVLIDSNEDGNIVLRRASTNIFPALLKNKIGGGNGPLSQNNIISANLNIDHSQVYSKYIASSQMNPATQSNSTEHSKIVTQIGSPAVNSDIRDSRILVIDTEESVDEETATTRAIWEANIRRARSISYAPIVQGHTVNGLAWMPNNLVQIDDDFAGIKGKMLIRSVEWTENTSEGSKTKLDLTYRDAYTLKAEQTARELNEDEGGRVWLDPILPDGALA